LGIATTYSECDSIFMQQYHPAPKRILTKLAEGVRYVEPPGTTRNDFHHRNDGFDNAEGDYICRVGDVVVSPEGLGYEILDRLGHGTFGQVLRCSTHDNRGEVAVKIIKNKPAYFQQGLVEVRILQQLNKSFDLRIVKMIDYFVFRKHLCIVFELLSVNLYEVIKHNSFRGLPFTMVRSLADQLVRCLVCLKMNNVLHCDLKPENILLMSKKNTKIKLIDFGSASFMGQQIYTYIQSRFYRSVDVILGILPFTPAIDMWSLGCIIIELFIGLPVFPGHSEYDQLSKIIELLGPMPASLLDNARNTRKFFVKSESPGAIEDTSPRRSYRFRTMEEYEEVTGKKERVGKKHLKVSSLRELIMTAPVRSESNNGTENPAGGRLSHDEILRREKILNLVTLCLEYDPLRRITPAQAITHPLFDDSAVCTNMDDIINWRPHSEEACMKRLMDDPNSFVHTSASGKASLLDSSGISMDNMIMNTPIKQASPLKPRNAQSVQLVSNMSGYPDDTVPVSYRPPLHGKAGGANTSTNSASSPLSRLPLPSSTQSPATVHRGGAASRMPPPGIPFSPNTSKYTLSHYELSPSGHGEAIGSIVANGRARVRAQSSIETELAHRWV
jgi:dual specificity protein kinase YAK1